MNKKQQQTNKQKTCWPKEKQSSCTASSLINDYYMYILQVKIKFRLILNFIHLLYLIIHELGLGGKENLELTYSVGQKILTWI